MTDSHFTRLMHRSRAAEVVRLFLVGIAAAAALMLSTHWPNTAFPLWTGFFALLALLINEAARGSLLVRALSKPINYESLSIADGAIEYRAFGKHTRILIADITEIAFVRSPALFDDPLTGPYLETSWMIRLGADPWIEVMDELPHRDLLVRTFAYYLPGFDRVAARAALASDAEGRWQCYAGQTSFEYR